MASHFHSHAHGHNHGHTNNHQRRNLFAAIILNAGITLAEAAGGIYSGSLSLLSDALHNLSDVAALVLSYLAIKLANRANDERYTFGYRRSTVLAAFVNAAVLVIISIFLFKEAYLKLLTPQPIREGIVIAVALLGFVANAIGVYLLEGGSRGDMNIRAAFLHLFSDALASLGVVCGGVIIIYTRAYWIDPLLTILIGVYVLKASYDILKQATNILMQGVPANIDLKQVIRAIEQVEGVEGVHHVHIWALDEQRISLDAHVTIADRMLSETEEILTGIKEKLEENYGISHVTLQLEQRECIGSCPFETAS